MSIDQHAQDIRRQLERDQQQQVRVALFGQPGAGKSSLINKLVGRKVAEVGVETDKTVAAQTYEHNGLVLVDLPGYGTARFPKQGYAERFNIDSMDLFLCVTSGKLHQADTEFFQELSRRGKVCIFVMNKHDELWEEDTSIEELEQRKRADLFRHLGREVPLVFTSCRRGTGLDTLQQRISEHLAPAKRERWVRTARAYSREFLAQKRAACEGMVSRAAWVSAANGLNPIPGADVAVDVGVLVKLFRDIRADYGLADDTLAQLRHSSLPVVARLATEVTKYAVREGVLLLLRRYVGRQVAKSLLRYVPVVGQALAASAGYAITSNAGADYLEECHKLAEQILENKLTA